MVPLSGRIGGVPKELQIHIHTETLNNWRGKGDTLPLIQNYHPRESYVNLIKE